MADETKKVLLEVVLDVNALKKNEADARLAVDKLMNKQSDLRKSGLETSRAYQLLSAEIKLHEKTIKAQGDALAINSKLQKQNTGSIIEQREQLKALKTEYLNLSKEERENTDRGKNLQKGIADLTQSLKDQEAALGDNRRNVGNYKEALKELNAQLLNMEPGTKEFQAAAVKAGELKDKINDTKDAVKAFATESKATTVKNLFGQVGRDLADLDFKGAAEKSKQFAQVVSTISFTEVISGLKNFGTSLLNVGKALLSNPFALIVAGVAALGFAFKHFYDSLDAGDESLKNARKGIADISKETNALRGELESLRIENRKAKGEISENTAQQLESERKFKDEFIKIRQQRAEALDKINKEFEEENTGDFARRFGGIIEKRETAILETNKAFADKETALQKILAQRLTNIKIEGANDIASKNKEAAIKELESKEEANKKLIEEEKKHAEELFEIQKRINLALYQGDLNRIEDERKAEEERKKLDLEKLDEQEQQAQKELAIERNKENQKLIDQEQADQRKIDQAIKTGAILTDVTSAVTDAITSSMEDGVLNTEKFGKALAISLLKITEKIALTQIAASTAQSLAQPDSVATFGASGIIRAAVLTALIKSAVGIASAQIQGFADGGKTTPLSGQLIGAANGLKITRSNGDNRLATVKTGEVILNHSQQSMLGGASTFKSIGVPGFAGGGVTMDGGFTARNATSILDSKIMSAIKSIPAPIVIVQDIAEKLNETNNVKDRASI